MPVVEIDTILDQDSDFAFVFADVHSREVAISKVVPKSTAPHLGIYAPVFGYGHHVSRAGHTARDVPFKQTPEQAEPQAYVQIKGQAAVVGKPAPSKATQPLNAQSSTVKDGASPAE
jgi:hypothetical protein